MIIIWYTGASRINGSSCKIAGKKMYNQHRYFDVNLLDDVDMLVYVFEDFKELDENLKEKD